MMPENKPMKMQWLNIDGRQVPSILPNYWNEQKNDWDITGTKNPLPIANYTQNASGVWLPTSESNPMPTQLTGSTVEVLAKHMEWSYLSTQVNGHLGQGAGLTATSPYLNVSRYPRRSIYIRNNHAEKVTFQIRASTEALPPRINLNQMNIELAAGATIFVTGDSVPFLNDPFLYLGVFAFRDNPQNDGSIDVIFYGGVS